MQLSEATKIRIKLEKRFKASAHSQIDRMIEL